MVCKSAEIGGPCRGRTYGPLIKSEDKGVAQVIEDLGNPFSFPNDAGYSIHPTLFQFVALRTDLSLSNTVITPEGSHTPANVEVRGRG